MMAALLDPVDPVGARFSQSIASSSSLASSLASTAELQANAYTATSLPLSLSSVSTADASFVQNLTGTSMGGADGASVTVLTEAEGVQASGSDLSHVFTSLDQTGELNSVLRQQPHLVEGESTSV